MASLGARITARVSLNAKFMRSLMAYNPPRLFLV
jgi:hypothetical protein